MKTDLFHFLVLAVLVFAMACAPFKDRQQTDALTFPELGALIKTNGALWYTTAQQVGTPIWPQPLNIQVQQLPFNKLSYSRYAQYMANAGKINSIAYVDSLPYKPKYVRLQIADKIKLVHHLNDTENVAVRAYLENDDAYKIVTTWNITFRDELMPKFMEATKVTLCEDPKMGKHLLLTMGKQEERIPFSEIQVFGYEYASFCWGEDRYHRKKIETLLSGKERCPKGSHKKAAKVTADRSYLKF